jgi:hypothetical protein
MCRPMRRLSPSTCIATAWNPPEKSSSNSYGGGMDVFRDPNAWQAESSLRRLRLVWPNPTPDENKDLTRDEEKHPRVEGECDDILKDLRLWDGIAPVNEKSARKSWTRGDGRGLCKLRA